jgi:hypothetical protein
MQAKESRSKQGEAASRPKQAGFSNMAGATRLAKAVWTLQVGARRLEKTGWTISQE